MKNINSYIDHTLLSNTAKMHDFIKLCKEARENEFATVCVPPHYVRLCVDELKGSEVKVCTVVGFPLGTSTVNAKAYEAEDAIQNGATEIDFVVNVNSVLNGDFEHVSFEMQSMVFYCQEIATELEKDVTVKVILETCLLNEEQIRRVCEIAVKNGVNFVKTSTGFSTGGATIEAVKLMKEVVESIPDYPEVKVKASGGIRSYEDAVAMIEAGAERLGTSAGMKIIAGEVSKDSY